MDWLIAMGIALNMSLVSGAIFAAGVLPSSMRPDHIGRLTLAFAFAIFITNMLGFAYMLRINAKLNFLQNHLRKEKENDDDSLYR